MQQVSNQQRALKISIQVLTVCLINFSNDGQVASGRSEEITSAPVYILKYVMCVLIAGLLSTGTAAAQQGVPASGKKQIQQYLRLLTLVCVRPVLLLIRWDTSGGIL